MPRTIRIAETIRAPRERLWHACTASDGIAGWQADEAEGDASFVGAAVTLGWPALGMQIELVVDEVVPEERVILSGGPGKVVFEVSEDEVAIVHHGLRSDDEAAGVASSWRAALAVLKHALAEHPGRSRRVLWAARPIRISAEQAYFFFTHRDAQQSWLTLESTGVEASPSSFRFRMVWDEVVSGAVLCRIPDRDLVVSWHEADNSVLVFRTFPAPLGKGERLVAIAWSRWHEHPAPARVQRELMRAIAWSRWHEHPAPARVQRELMRALERLGRLLERPGKA